MRRHSASILTPSTVPSSVAIRGGSRDDFVRANKSMAKHERSRDLRPRSDFQARYFSGIHLPQGSYPPRRRCFRLRRTLYKARSGGVIGTMIRSLPLTMKSLDMIRVSHFSNRKSKTTLLSDQVLTVTLTLFDFLPCAVRSSLCRDHLRQAKLARKWRTTTGYRGEATSERYRRIGTALAMTSVTDAGPQ